MDLNSIRDGAFGRPGRNRLLIGIGLALALAVCTLLAYSHALSGDLGGDASLLVQQPRVQAASPDNFHAIFAENYWYPLHDSNLYRPIVTLSYLFNRATLGGGDSPFTYHLINLIFHLISVWLVFLVVRLIFAETLAAWFAALLFALHPVNVEAVTNIAGRADTMAAVGVLLALYLHIRFSANLGGSRYAAAAGIFLASIFALFSKENGVIICAVLPFYDWTARPRPFQWRRLSPAYFAIVGAVALSTALRMHLVAGWHVQEEWYVNNPLLGAGFWRARLSGATLIWRGIGLLFWPNRLSWDYSYNQIPVASVMAGVLAVAGLTAVVAATLWFRPRFGRIAFFALFFLAAVAPSANLVILLNTVFGERMLYIPSIALAVGVAIAVFRAGQFLPKYGNRAAVIVLTLAAVALGVRTFHRDADWADNTRLVLADAESAPASYWTQLYAGIKLFSNAADDYSLNQAIARAQRSVDIVDSLPPVSSAPAPYAMLGYFYKFKAEHSDASLRAQYYAKALALFDKGEVIDLAQRRRLVRLDRTRGWPLDRIPRKGLPMLYEHSANTHLALKQYELARQDAATWLTIEPLTAKPYELMAAIDYADGRTADAVDQLFEAVEATENRTPEPQIGFLLRSADTAGCAVNPDGSLNPGCPSVTRFACAAHLDLLRLLTDSGHADDLAKFKSRGPSGCEVEPGSRSVAQSSGADVSIPIRSPNSHPVSPLPAGLGHSTPGGQPANKLRPLGPSE